MVQIKQIQEPTGMLMYNTNEIVGEITSGLQFTDICVQIKEQSLTGYSLEIKGISYPITSEGRIINTNSPTPYPLLGQLLRKLI